MFFPGFVNRSFFPTSIFFLVRNLLLLLHVVMFHLVMSLMAKTEPRIFYGVNCKKVAAKNRLEDFFEISCTKMHPRVLLDTLSAGGMVLARGNTAAAGTVHNRCHSKWHTGKMVRIGRCRLGTSHKYNLKPLGFVTIELKTRLVGV